MPTQRSGMPVPSDIDWMGGMEPAAIRSDLDALRSLMDHALRHLECAAIGAVESIQRVPPAAPADGEAYIVEDEPLGAWGGQAGKVAYYDAPSGVWRFLDPAAFLEMWVSDVATMARFVPVLDGARIVGGRWVV